MFPLLRDAKVREIEEFFVLMSEILTEYGVETFVPAEPSDVIIAERLRSESSALTFFDSVYATTSKRLNLKLLSSDGICPRIGLETIDLDKI